MVVAYKQSTEIKMHAIIANSKFGETKWGSNDRSKEIAS
jgi:hypothetical protein